MDEAAEFAVGGILGIFAWFFGGLDGYLNVLITFIVINLILRCLDNIINKTINFYGLLQDIGKKITILCLVGVSHIFDKYLLGDTSAVRTGVTLFYAIIEFTGILKHAHNLGVQVPNFLIDKLKVVLKQFNIGDDGEKAEQQVLDNYFDIKEYINLEEKKEAEKIEQIDKIERATLNKDFIESLTGVYSDTYDF